MSDQNWMTSDRRSASRQRWLVFSLVVVLTLTVMFSLFLKSRGPDIEQHADVLHQIEAIRSLNAQLNSEVLRLDVGIAPHMDPLVAIMARLQQHLRDFPLSLSPEFRRETHRELARLQTLEQKKSLLIEDFKSQIGVTRNSRNFLPSLLHEWQKGTRNPQDLSLAYQLVETGLIFSYDSTDRARIDLEQALIQFGEHTATLTPGQTPGQTRSARDLLAHSQRILLGAQELDALVADAMGIPIDAATRDLEQTYMTGFTARKAEQDFYRLLMFILGFAMALAVFAGFVYLRIQAHRLRDANHQLNFQKFALDQHALVSITDVRGNITYANDKFCQRSGYSQQELLGQNHNIINSGLHSKALFRDMWRDIANGRVWHGEIRNESKDGEYYWVNSTIVPFLNQQGKPYQYVSIRTDITKRKRMEADLIQAQQDAEQANEAKSEFLANMSHEIRTPMNSIIGMSHLALQTDLNPRQQGYISKVSKAAESLLGIINDILDFSKIEAGKLDMEHIDFALADVLDNLANLIGYKAAEKDLELLFDLDEHIPPVLIGDPLRLGQVLINLCNNAVKFTESGEILVSSRMLESTADGARVEFTIKDSGIGMTEEQTGRLFQAFSQADTSTTRQYGGTGLGLAISKQLVQAMQGEIDVRSEPGQGSAFRFTCRFGVNADAKTMALKPSGKVKDLKVLVVDDNATAREIFFGLLESFGYQVQTAHSGQTAINTTLQACADAQPFDLILMDWQMPAMDGLQAAQVILETSGQCVAPSIVMVTSYGREELLANQHDLTLSGILSKPVTASVLLETIIQAKGETVPEASLHPHTRHEQAVKVEHELSGAHVLLVEDNLMNQELALELLGLHGISAEVADNGKEALQRLSMSDFDGVLMDAQMPIMDGYTATREIRKQAQFADLPIIAMTANAMQGDREKCLDAGMNDHIPKPINVDQMLLTMAKWIHPSRPIARTEAEHTAMSTKSDIEAESGLDNGSDDPRLKYLVGLDLNAGLEMAMNDVTLFLKLITLIQESEQDFEARFRQAWEARDWETATRYAHTLKGATANIGGQQVVEAAGQLEKACKNQSTDQIDVELQRTLAALTPVLDGIRAQLKAL